MNRVVYKNTFKREGIDINYYIQEKGFTLKSPSGGSAYYYEDGEVVFSRYEDIFTAFLRVELQFKFKREYDKERYYKDIFPECQFSKRQKSDYIFYINQDISVIEIAGYLNGDGKDWRTYDYNSKAKNDYRDKLIKKEELLVSAKAHYLFLFPIDFIEGRFRIMTKEFLQL